MALDCVQYSNIYIYREREGKKHVSVYYSFIPTDGVSHWAGSHFLHCRVRLRLQSSLRSGRGRGRGKDSSCLLSLSLSLSLSLCLSSSMLRKIANRILTAYKLLRQVCAYCTFCDSRARSSTSCWGAVTALFCFFVDWTNPLVIHHCLLSMSGSRAILPKTPSWLLKHGNRCVRRAKLKL